MENLYIAETPSSPEIDFNYSSHLLSMRGESYPENAAKFYGPVLHSLNGYLDSLSGQRVEFQIALTYFNSSSTKVLYNIMRALDEAAARDNLITVNWYYDEEDDTIHEIGQELHEDYPAVTFNAEPVRT
jgi:hypothetical protein